MLSTAEGLAAPWPCFAGPRGPREQRDPQGELWAGQDGHERLLPRHVVLHPELASWAHRAVTGQEHGPIAGGDCGCSWEPCRVLVLPARRSPFLRLPSRRVLL